MQIIKIKKELYQAKIPSKLKCRKDLERIQENSSPAGHRSTL